jgi:hypothetical protein
VVQVVKDFTSKVDLLTGKVEQQLSERNEHAAMQVRGGLSCQYRWPARSAKTHVSCVLHM